MDEADIVQAFFNTLDEADKVIFLNTQRYIELIEIYNSFKAEMLKEGK